MDNLNNKTE